jgi:uncharacterized protein
MSKLTKYLLNLVTAILLASFSMAALATEKGLFWKLESPTGVVSYLFGTIHTDDNRVADISPNVQAAIKSVDVFMMEAEQGNDPSALMMQGRSLAEMITEPEFEQVKTLADFHTMHFDAAMQMKPWLLAVIFDLHRPQTPFNLDNLLMTKAEESGKKVQGIETAKEHFGVMDDFSIEEQMVMFRAVLKRTPEQKEADFESLMAEYLKGDSDKITALNEKITAGMLPADLWAKIKDKLLDKRSVAMAQRAIPVANEKPVFIAVGASHLAGDIGLIAAFKKAGFKLSAMHK